MLQRAGLAGAGLILSITFFIGLAWLLAGSDLLGSFVRFARSINQGNFGLGWKLVLDYFWAAEGLNFLLGATGMVLVAGGALAARRWNYGMGWLAGALGVLGVLLFCADGWHLFVIYGRTARQVVPFVCLAGAFAWERGWRSGRLGRSLAVLVLVLTLVQAVANFSTPLRQVFPAEFKRMVAAKTQQLQAQGETRQLVMIYADHLLGRQGIIDNIPDHDVVLEANNPLQFEPYLFEGFTDGFRRFLAQCDIRMRLIAINDERFADATNLRFPYPGVVCFTLHLPHDRPNYHEPLLVTGHTGAADMIYVIYELPGAIRLGFDHWGVGGELSEPLAVDFNQPVRITLSSGPLHEPTADPMIGERDWRRWLYAEVNGRIVWSHAADFHPAPRETIFYGRNYLGGSTCEPGFTGSILKVESVPAPGRAQTSAP